MFCAVIDCFEDKECSFVLRTSSPTVLPNDSTLLNRKKSCAGISLF